MIITGNLLLPGEGRTVNLAPGWLRVEDGRIVEVHQDGFAESADLGSKTCLVAPGFVDTHLHLPQIYIIGAYGMELLDWLQQVTFPAEACWKDPVVAADMTADTIRQLLAHGTTSFLAYGTVHAEGVAAALQTCADHGLRAAVGQVLMNQNCPDYLSRPTRQLLSETEKLLEEWPVDSGNSRVSAAVAPRFAITCTADLMAGAAELANAHNALIETHLAEMKPECELTLKLHGGPDYTSVYQRAGLLTSRTVLGHCIWLSEDELAMLSDSGSIAAHCPLANSFLRSGTMNRSHLLDSGVRVSLGSDLGGGYERSMVRVARNMLEVTQYARSDSISVAEAWWQITAGNADCLGWNRTGRLAPGAEADIVFIEPDIPWLESSDPLANLMFAWDDRWIDTTLVAGQVAWETV